MSEAGIPAPGRDDRRVALITGAARGIGAAIARRLAADGFCVAINYASSAEDAERLAKEIDAAGGTAAALQADISDATAAANLVAETTKRWGPPLVLVNNAGLHIHRSVRKQDPADWDRVIGVNLSGAFYCTHYALPAMYEAGYGRVVLLGSPVAERTIIPGMAAYSAAKAGVMGFVRTLAAEVVDKGITVNSVLPGFVDTEMTRAGGDDATALMQAWPPIAPEDIAATVSFLVSEQAGRISGEEIGVWAGGPQPGRIRSAASRATSGH
ncbi:SDR family NAD(P)-dependent oxidoreductase [Mycobacterium sp.]|uniref:SDR family oxidoreductase n=1 Tax=Mycobacterium sp. TaxID=1785 RepID=UPI0025DA732D|nr:SDR family NAD(P)-dependent oxidoreductase [Mycobacterium sp.]